jgi:hypothetical protein
MKLSKEDATLGTLKCRRWMMPEMMQTRMRWLSSSSSESLRQTRQGAARFGKNKRRFGALMPVFVQTNPSHPVSATRFNDLLKLHEPSVECRFPHQASCS